MRSAAICALAVASPAVAGGDHNGRSYGNNRFNYAICYPADLLTAGGESDSGDGQIFAGRDGARLSIYGFNNPDLAPLAADLDTTIDDLPGPDARIT